MQCVYAWNSPLVAVMVYCPRMKENNHMLRPALSNARSPGGSPAPTNACKSRGNVQSRVVLAKMMLVMKSNMYMECIVLLKRTLSP